MATDRPNYCQVLGLNPLTEGKYNPDSIRKRIELKKTKWSNDSNNKQNDPGMRYRSEQYVKLIPRITEVMNDPELRKREFAEGLKVLKNKAQSLRSSCIVLTDGTEVVPTSVAEEFTKGLQWDDVKKEDVFKVLNIAQGKPPSYASTNVINVFKALNDVATYTPAEMLNNLINNSKLEIDLPPLSEGSSISQIKAAFEVCEKRVNNVRTETLPEQDSYIQTMRSLKLMFKNDKDLEELIRLGRCQRELIKVFETIENEATGYKNRKYFDELLDAQKSNTLDRNLAILILQDFCYRKKIPANFSDSERNMTRCPQCETMISIGKDTVFCPNCGKNIRTTCPKCKTIQQTTNSVCIKCRFDLRNGLKDCEKSISDFRQLLQTNRVHEAEKVMAHIRDQYPWHTDVPNLRMDLERSKSKISGYRGLIAAAYDAKKVHEVKVLTDELAAQYPGILDSDPELSKWYKSCLDLYNTAESYCHKALTEPSRQKRTALYVMAIKNCPDHPKAKTKLREDPPSGPLGADGNLTNGMFQIIIEPPADEANVTYSVYRYEESGRIITDEDEPYAEFSGKEYIDRNVEPGATYYYWVYSKRWGVLSQDRIMLGPVIYIAEVDRVVIEPLDGGLHIEFDIPPGASRVRVWRASDGVNPETEIPLNGKNVYDDLGLIGGRKYSYVFVTEYDRNGTIERSMGRIFSETPIDAPEPVHNLEVQWSNLDSTYIAHWNSTSHVTLYFVEKRMSIGTLVEMKDIVSWMKPVETISVYDDGVKFSIPDGAIHYVYPVIQCGRLAVCGKPFMVANLKPFRDVEYRISNNDCVLNMVWPDDAIEARITVSNGNEIKLLEDPDAEIVTIRREEYEKDMAIRIPMGHTRRKCINMYAIYKHDGRTMPSRGFALDIHSGESKKVRYSFKRGKKNTVGIQLETDSGVYELPPMMLIQSSKGIPLKRTDGEVMWRSNGKVHIQNGKTEIEVICSGTVDTERSRLFFENDLDYYDYRFIHPLKRRS